MPTVHTFAKLSASGSWFMVRGLKNKSAYTLIELLVVIALLAIAVTSILAFLTANIKSSNQVNVNSEVKQNAEAVLASLEKEIRNADKAEGIITGSSFGIMLTRQTGYPLYLICKAPDTGNVASSRANGLIGKYIGAVAPPNENSYEAITNTNLTSGISIENCKFVVYSNAGAPQTVSISFDAFQAVNAPSRQDYKVSYHIQSTFSLRRYN